MYLFMVVIFFIHSPFLINIITLPDQYNYTLREIGPELVFHFIIISFILYFASFDIRALNPWQWQKTLAHKNGN